MRKANVLNSIKCIINNQNLKYMKTTTVYVCSNLMINLKLNELECELYSVIYIFLLNNDRFIIIAAHLLDQSINSIILRRKS